MKEGAELVVDGRGFKMQGYENGFYLGGSLFDRVTPTCRPIRTRSSDPFCRSRAQRISTTRSRFRPIINTAMALLSSHATATPAREFASRVQVGMVGINIPIPVPLAYHTFGGWKRSAFGDVNQHGPEGVRFYTRIKTVTPALAQRRRARKSLTSISRR